MKTVLLNYLAKIWHEAATLNNNIIISEIEPKANVNILDIGFFRGDLVTKRFKKNKNSQIYGVDIDAKAISSAKDLGIITKKYNIEKGLPYKSDFFDIVVANQIIEHLIDIDLFVKEIFRVLKPYGYVVVSTENLSSWHNIFALVLGWQAFSQHISTKIYIGNPMRLTQGEASDIHNKIFTLRGLKDLFNTYNFKIEGAFGAGYYPMPGILGRILAKLDPYHSAYIGFKARKNL